MASSFLQFYSLQWNGQNISLNTECKHCSEIAKKICLENGNVLCKEGMVNMTGIMEKMKMAYHSATMKDFMSLKENLLESNISWKSATEDEVILFFVWMDSQTCLGKK